MLRPVGRALFLAITLLASWTLWYTLEPRKTAYSCRTFWSCVGFGTRHGYAHDWPSAKEASAPVEIETVLRDGTKRFDRHILPDNYAETLVLVLTKDASSWASDFRSSQRTAYDFLDLLVGTGLDLSTVALGVLTSSGEEYETLKLATARLPLARSAIFHRPPFATESNADKALTYKNRHDPSVQLARRSAIAKVRNYLMLRALRDEAHIIWLDADVVELSPLILQTVLAHAETNITAGIITARCQQNQMDNYDKNSWKLSSSENAVHLQTAVADADREAALTDLVATRTFVPALINNTVDDALVPLDSVGGTLLYIRAALVRQGLVFPIMNIVGTTWAQFGWIGVETEGLCYVAKGLDGGGCYVLGRNHWSRHADLG